MGGVTECRGGGADPVPSASDVQEVAEAAWLAARQERAARFHGFGYCPTKVAPYGVDDPDAARVVPACRTLGCLDLHHELLARLLEKLRGAAARRAMSNVGAYAYRTAGTQLSELRREERTAVGFPAKPTRLDGAAGRVDAELRAVAGPQGEWLSTLFRIMRAYPFTPHRVVGRWPVDGLAAERARHLPNDADQTRAVRQDIATVLDCARTLTGKQWVYDNLILPLNTGDLSLDVPGLREPEAADDTQSVLGRLLVAAYRRQRRSGLGPREALQRAAREVTGLDAPAHSREVAEALDDLENAVA